MMIHEMGVSHSVEKLKGTFDDLHPSCSFSALSGISQAEQIILEKGQMRRLIKSTLTCKISIISLEESSL